jgi:uncharacterized membrane protein YphA (DoxX/SURF4 family)
MWPETALRVGFGIVWGVNAGLKWLPGFRDNYLAVATGAAKGQPDWLDWWFRFWVDIQRPHPLVFAYTIAVIETLIALSLILGFVRKTLYIAGAVFSFFIWAVAEGFGGPYTLGSTDIGSAIIYVIVFLALLVILAIQGRSRYSLDALIEERVGWWYKLAEIGTHRSK